MGFPTIIVSLLLALLMPLSATAAEVPLWGRYEVVLPDTTYAGNPFDVELEGVFTHTATGRALTVLGFYAGANTWKIFFMPEAVGEWTFSTRSADPDLDGQLGSLTCVSSALPGRLAAEGNRWRFSNGEYDAPILIPSREYLKSTEIADGVGDFIVWADDIVGARILGTTLVYFSHPEAASVYLPGQEGDAFNIPMWDRLNTHYDAMRERGMGHYIMFFSDDAESPSRNGIAPNSKREQRLFRYALARFGAYPIVFWDTGIDISEYRDQDWIHGFAKWFNTYDPWQHPVSSRSGGGSGGTQPLTGSYWSDGTAGLPDHATFVSTWLSRTVPTAFTDRWREGDSRGGWTRSKLRRAAWEIGLVGGSAIYVSDALHSGYLNSDYATVFDAAPDFGFASRFFRERVDQLGLLEPHDELISTSSAGTNVLAARLGREYVAYIGGGGGFSVDLSDAVQSLTAVWYDPRSGLTTPERTITVPSGEELFVPPGSGDWVLHINLGQSDTSAPAQPEDLRVD